MLIKQVMARPVPTHPKWKYSLNRESMILFFHKKILYGANVVYAEGWQQSKKRMAYSTIFPAIYNPQIQISAESETKRSIFREKDKTKRSKKESAQHSKSRNKSFVMTSVSAL